MSKYKQQNLEEEKFFQASETRGFLAARLIRQIRDRLDELERLLGEDGSASGKNLTSPELSFYEDMPQFSSSGSDRVIDGVFDGERMIGEDGRGYPIPPNYASKSKLVEGDLLRLTVIANGRFLFKQKGPVERQRMRGTLIHDERTDAWSVFAEGSKYRVLKASVSYFKGEPGDEAVILVPRGVPSRWGAVEQVIPKS